MKTTKGGKVMNPTDAYRKEIRKMELKRNKKERKKVREVGILKKDPESIKEQIDKLEKMKADGALDKARKHKKRQLEDTLNMVMKKRKEYEEKMKEKGETPVMFSHLGPLRRRSAAEEDDRAKHPKVEDSVYYHPTLNPTGAPPPGKPPMYKSSIGSRIPLPSSGAGASCSMSESEEAGPSTLPPPPPPPPLPVSGEPSTILTSIPLPPPPPAPPADAKAPGLPPPPPPPPGPPPREQITGHTILPPPPPLPVQRPLQPPPPPGTNFKEPSNNQTAGEGINLKDSPQAQVVLPPPPPPGLPKSTAIEPDSTTSEAGARNAPGTQEDASKVARALPLPPPPPLLAHFQPVPPRPPMMPPLQCDISPLGIARFPPPPPPPDMRPQLMVPGIQGRPPPPPPGLPPAQIPRPPFGLPPGPPPMFMPPVVPGPPTLDDDFNSFAPVRPQLPQKPSYVKSAASTVVKRPLAHHTPELTAMVPASVRVKRESAIPKGKPKTPVAALSTSARPPSITTTGKASVAATSVPKPQSIDDSYVAFLEDMKELGALDG